MGHLPLPGQDLALRGQARQGGTEFTQREAVFEWQRRIVLANAAASRNPDVAGRWAMLLPHLASACKRSSAGQNGDHLRLDSGAIIWGDLELAELALLPNSPSPARHPEGSGRSSQW